MRVREALVPSAGVEIAARETGDPSGPAVVLMHGIFATRDHVLMGSTRLEDAGFRVIKYDARGHGRSTAPPSSDDYGYDWWLEDLRAVLRAFDAHRALLLGVSLGAHTALRLALEEPERVAGLAVVTPSYDPEDHPNAEQVRKADKLAAALRRTGVPGFMEALELPPAWGDRADTFRKVLGRRMYQHHDLKAVADGLQAVWRDRPYGHVSELRTIAAPAVVVGSRDEYEVDHPHELAERYAAALPAAELVCEAPGTMPLGWNGAALGARVLEVASRAGARPSALATRG
jgi:pimeloyl-ACP methyl ester carboxylesterase